MEKNRTPEPDPIGRDITAKDVAEEVFNGAKMATFPPDPWEHRSMRMSCRTCMWYLPKKKAPRSRNTAPIGRCRRHAPTMNGYPVVFETDWCGDHKLDEDKI